MNIVAKALFRAAMASISAGCLFAAWALAENPWLLYAH